MVLPEVACRNGKIVVDELHELGLTKVTLASRDEQNQFVLLPANWTAVEIEPGPGTTVKSDDTVSLIGNSNQDWKVALKKNNPSAARNDVE